MNKDSSIDIPLDFPITIDGVEQSALTMRRPKVRDVTISNSRSMSDEEKTKVIYSRLCGIPPQSIVELDLADFGKLNEAFADFTG